MKFNVIAFSITSLIMASVFSLILFIWCYVNGFGSEIVRLFESVHPSGGFSILKNSSGSIFSAIIPIVINTLYSAIDGFIVGFAFSGLYNFLAAKFEPAVELDSEETEENE
jgi:hypothetical protein